MATQCDNLPLAVYAVDVNIVPQSDTPTKRGFGNILFCTDDTGEASGNPADATTLVRTYSTSDISTVIEDYGIASEVYAAFATVATQNPKPVLFKVGFVAAGLLVGVQACADFDCDFYGLAVGRSWRDVSADNLAVQAWMAARVGLFACTTNDPKTLIPAQTGHLAKDLQDANMPRTICEYSSDPLLFPDLAELTVILTRDFDSADSYYTSKFKTHRGIKIERVSASEYMACTGFIPNEGLSSTTGYFCNIYINTQTPLHAEGICTDGRFTDQVHYADWLKEAIQIEMFTVMKQAAYVPYTDAGIAQLGLAIKRVLNQGIRNGGIAKQAEDDDGLPVAPYSVLLPRRFQILQAKRAQRIVPNIKCSIFMNNAIHYASVLGKAGV